MLKAYYKKNAIEAGCDEAGRGCLAGPVVAAAVVLPKGFKNRELNDSKQLSESKRNELRVIIEKEALCFAVGMLTNEEIDRINILNASFRAMHKAVDQLTTKPGFLLIDGNRFIPYPGIPHACMVKGDARFLSIAAASVLAKTYRDDLMKQLHREFPLYGWSQNKGYPTVSHRKAIKQHGVTPYHRMSFRLLPAQLSLEL
ncbi:MAG: ribonuclease HII [Flavobacteriales bacterium]